MKERVTLQTTLTPHWYKFKDNMGHFKKQYACTYNVGLKFCKHTSKYTKTNFRGFSKHRMVVHYGQGTSRSALERVYHLTLPDHQLAGYVDRAADGYHVHSPRVHIPSVCIWKSLHLNRPTCQLWMYVLYT